jgi:hypothetical protein
VRFHEIATARKLALASRGFEVQNIFIDTLYDAAIKANVPAAEWGEFVRFEIPSPRAPGDAAADDEVIEEVSTPKGVHKVRKAVKKMANVRGWMSKVTPPAAEVVAAAPLMERPDDMPLGDTLLGDDAVWGHAGKTLHKEVAGADSHVAAAHLNLLSITDDPEGGTPSTRAQRYNAKLRERMEARAARGSPRH